MSSLPQGSEVDRPYLSMVTPSRNDDYGGGMLRRLQFTVDLLLQQLETRGIRSELIIVDWNHPADRPRLKDALVLPNKTRYCTIRALEVAPPHVGRTEMRHET